MKVILLKNVDGTGKKNEIREVSIGYARNFLIPKKLAVPATIENTAQLENKLKLEEQKAEENLKIFEDIVVKLDGREILIPVKTGKEGQVYESVTKQKIADALKEQGFEVTKNQIELECPIKELGEFEVNVVLDHNLEAEIKVIIIEKEEE